MKQTKNLTSFILQAFIIILSASIIMFLLQLNSNLNNQAKITEEKINSLNLKIDTLTQKTSDLQLNTAANSLLLEKILSGNLTEADKLCNKLSNIIIEKAYYNEGLLFIKISNENNQDISGFSFKLINDKTAASDSNEILKAFETNEYSFNNINITKVAAIPKVSVDNNLSLCEKQVVSEVKKYFDINGNFNVSAKLIASGQEKNVSLITNFIQEENNIKAETRVLKETGEYGEMFMLEGNLNEEKLTLSGKDVVIPAGSIEGINSDVKADISLSGTVFDNNYVEGKNLGDIKLSVKDAIPGVTITVDGYFNAIKI